MFIRERGGWAGPGEEEGDEDGVYLSVFISNCHLSCIYHVVSIHLLY